jgi:sugar/nucleoside kinase (ribokinase family)
MGVIGRHPLSQFALADLQHLAVIDLAPASTEPIPTSSILVTEATGERAVISLNAVRLQAQPAQIPAGSLTDVEVLLLDGHQMAVGAALAQQARALGIPVVVDAGSWKPGFETVLSQADYVIASANFAPPHCQTHTEVVQYLQTLGVTQIAVTQGEAPIRFYSPIAQGEIAVPQVQAVDTVGAGDVLHGAFCHFILQTDFRTALVEAAVLASQSCRFFGTRRWMQPSAALE